MTNFVHALAVLEAARRPGEIRIHPHDAVEALAKAGLIMTDLPEPNDPGIFVPDGKGWIPGGPHGLACGQHQAAQSWCNESNPATSHPTKPEVSP